MFSLKILLYHTVYEYIWNFFIIYT